MTCSAPRIGSEGGFLLYLRQEGRGIGLYANLDAYALQDSGLDTYEANLALGRAEDERDYTAAARMLAGLGVRRIRLLSNNPDKAARLEQNGVHVVARVPTGVHLSPSNTRYLSAKRERTAHTLTLPDAALAAAGIEVDSGLMAGEARDLNRQRAHAGPASALPNSRTR